MTDLLKKALKAVSELPPEKQDQAARAMLEVVNGAQEEIYVLSEEDNAAIDEGIAQLERGEFVAEEELRANLAKYRI